MTDPTRRRADAPAAPARSAPQRQIDCTGPASWARAQEAPLAEPRGRAPRQTLPILDAPRHPAS